MTEKLPSCCKYHGFEEGGCNGRHCPAGRLKLPRWVTDTVLWTLLAIVFTLALAISAGAFR